MASSGAATACRFAASSVLACVLVIGPAVAAIAGPPDPQRLPYYSTPDFTAEWLAAREVARAHRIAPFSFVDQNGAIVSNESLRGKIYVANFFYSACRSLCPRMANTFQRLQTAFAADPAVVLVSHTVDPATDTQAHLQTYARAVGARPGKWHLLTGDRNAIYTLARTSYFAEKDVGLPAMPDEFLHTENMLLIDKHGHIRGIYNATLPVEASRVIEDVTLLEAEP